MEPADVLAALDSISVRMSFRADASILCEQVASARAAVAQLIEENKQLRIKANNWDSLMHARETSAAEPDDSQWKQLARRAELIEAIKACRSAHGYSLREAKDCVEGYVARFRGGAA